MMPAIARGCARCAIEVVVSAITCAGAIVGSCPVKIVVSAIARGGTVKVVVPTAASRLFFLGRSFTGVADVCDRIVGLILAARYRLVGTGLATHRGRIILGTDSSGAGSRAGPATTVPGDYGGR